MALVYINVGDSICVVNMEVTDLKRLQVASNEARFLLLKSLIENGGGYIAQLSKKLDIERKTTTFHLKQLEDVGLMEGKYLIGEDNDS
jgi:predicted transcriptional regulator